MPYTQCCYQNESLDMCAVSYMGSVEQGNGIYSAGTKIRAPASHEGHRLMVYTVHNTASE